MDKEPEKKKLSFFQRCKEAFNGVSRKDFMKIVKDTLKDLRKPQEIGLLIGCTFLPGGWIGYGVYRIARYQQKKKNANDNKPPSLHMRQPPPRPPSP